jgi:hypothetical protein
MNIERSTDVRWWIKAAAMISFCRREWPALVSTRIAVTYQPPQASNGFSHRSALSGGTRERIEFPGSICCRIDGPAKRNDPGCGSSTHVPRRVESGADGRATYETAQARTVETSLDGLATLREPMIPIPRKRPRRIKVHPEHPPDHIKHEGKLGEGISQSIRHLRNGCPEADKISTDSIGGWGD